MKSQAVLSMIAAGALIVSFPKLRFVWFRWGSGQLEQRL